MTGVVACTRALHWARVLNAGDDMFREFIFQLSVGLSQYGSCECGQSGERGGGI